MAIKDGNVAEAADVINLGGQLFENQCLIMWNNIYAGWDSDLLGTGTPIYTKAFFNTLLPSVTITDAGTATPTWISYDSSYYSGVLYDIYNSTVDTSLWEGNNCTLSEDTVSLVGTKSVAPKATQTINVREKGLDYKAGTDSVVESITSWKSVYVTNSGGSTFYTRLELFDGTTSVTLKTGTFAGDTSNNTTHVKVTNSGGSYSCQVNGANVNISSLNTGATDWTVRVVSNLYNDSSSGTGSITAEFLTYLYADGSGTYSTNGVIESDLGTATESISDIYMYMIENFDDVGATVDFTFAADGSTFATVSNRSFSEVTPTGTDAKIKVTVSGTPTELVKIGEVGLSYNLSQP